MIITVGNICLVVIINIIIIIIVIINIIMALINIMGRYLAIVYPMSSKALRSQSSTTKAVTVSQQLKCSQQEKKSTSL